LDRDLRDNSRKVQNLERSKDKAEEQISQLNKDLLKQKDELNSTTRKIVEFENSNRVLERDVEAQKNKSSELENELDEVKKEIEKEKKKKSSKAKKLSYSDDE